MKSFFKMLLAAAVSATAFASVQAQAPAPRVLKFQSTWPASLTLQENFKYFAERVDKLSGGALKVEALAAGQVVPAFEILDATHKRVIDGGHGV
ncbi:MAG: C4-dicarboxylate ABC transporter, partial [Betaproteobacteria bacterium]|nr:C4-dicarboxylate ABC transporter [Betaproteobacteria bacterium]